MGTSKELATALNRIVRSRAVPIATLIVTAFFTLSSSFHATATYLSVAGLALLRFAVAD